MAIAGDRWWGRRQRLFVALDLPDPVRAGLEAWGETELADPGLRPVRPVSLHLTLVFLGTREPRAVAEITAAVREIEAVAPLLKLEDPVPLPPRGRPSHFVLPAPSPATTDLHRGVVERLAEIGLYEPEDRDFWPHVTVARVRPEGGGSRRPAAVARRPGDLPDGLKEPFYGVRLTLYRSELQPGGARYAPLAQVELP
jgi:RNA 2',3'-cyclic 3'-phosphodiesterase